MVEKEIIFSSNTKYTGIFSFRAFYKFCYDWLSEELDLKITEKKYKEKLIGTSKDIEVEWYGQRKVTDYFKFDVKVEFVVRNLVDVEVAQGGAKIKTNEGEVQIKVKGTLVRDYAGKFETTAFNKFMRSTYEKWVIPSRIEQFEDKLVSNMDEFLAQAKAYLDLEGKR